MEKSDPFAAKESLQLWAETNMTFHSIKDLKALLGSGSSNTETINPALVGEYVCPTISTLASIDDLADLLPHETEYT